MTDESSHTQANHDYIVKEQTIHLLSADIARRVPDLNKECLENRVTVIENLIREANL